MTDATAPAQLDTPDAPLVADSGPPVDERPTPTAFWSSARIVGLVGALGTMLWMMWPAFRAKLGIIDDHEIVDMIGHHSHLPVTRIPYEIVSRTDEANGRFRPFYWVIRVIESAVAGHNGTLWYADRFLLAALGVAAIYLTAVRFMPPFAAVVVSLVPFGGPQWEAFIRLGPNEAYAFPLMLAGIAVLVSQLAKGRSPAGLWLGYLLLALSAFTKENFFVILVMAVPVTALVYGRKRLQRNDYLVMGGALVVAAIDMVAILIVVHEYGAVYPQSRTWDTFRSWTTYALTQMNMYEYCTVGIVTAVALLGAWSINRRRLLISASLVAVAVFIAATQLGFYAGNPQVGRYLYPLVLVPTLAWGVSLWQAHILPTVIARVTTSAVLLIALLWPLHHAIYLSHEGAKQTAATTTSFQTNLANLINVAHANKDTVVVLQPINSLVDGERMLSLARYLINTTDLTVLTLPPTQVGGGQDAQVAAQMAGWSKDGFDGIKPYAKPTVRCLSVIFGTTPPVCKDAITPPG